MAVSHHLHSKAQQAEWPLAVAVTLVVRGESHEGLPKVTLCRVSKVTPRFGDSLERLRGPSA